MRKKKRYLFSTAGRGKRLACNNRSVRRNGEKLRYSRPVASLMDVECS
jgi:hypothetical protein